MRRVAIGLALGGLLAISASALGFPGGEHIGDISDDGALGGTATDDIDLDTGGYSLILDNGATGAGNGAIYFGQDTDLCMYRAGADTLQLDGTLTVGGAFLNLNSTPGVSTTALKGSGLSVLIRNGADSLYGDMALSDITVRDRIYFGTVTSTTRLTDDGVNGNLIVSNENGSQGVNFITSTDGRLGFTTESGGTLTAGVGPITGKGAATFIKTKTESVTFSAAPGDASQVTAGGIIPAGAFVVGVSGRVTTANTGGCASVDIGIAAKDTDAFADGVAVALGTTFTPADGEAGADYSATSLGLLPSVGSQEITVTAVGGDGACDDLAVALTVHYLDVTAATSN